jgi:hypothetical protein
LVERCGADHLLPLTCSGRHRAERSFVFLSPE